MDLMSSQSLDKLFSDAKETPPLLHKNSVLGELQNKPNGGVKLLYIYLPYLPLCLFIIFNARFTLCSRWPRLPKT